MVSFVYERGWRQGFAWAGEAQHRAGQQGGAAGCSTAGRTRSFVFQTVRCLVDSYSSEAATFFNHCLLQASRAWTRSLSMQWSTWHLHTARCACLLRRAAVQPAGCAGARVLLMYSMFVPARLCVLCLPWASPLLPACILYRPPFARIGAPSTDAGGHELRLGPVLPPLPQERPLRGRHCSRLQVIEGSKTAVEDRASLLVAAVLPTGDAASFAALPTCHLAPFHAIPSESMLGQAKQYLNEDPTLDPSRYLLLRADVGRLPFATGSGALRLPWSGCAAAGRGRGAGAGWPWSGCGG